MIGPADLVAADPTAGMKRELAFELPLLWAGQVETAPGAVSGWHHHDRNESSLYVVRGVLRLEFEGHEGYLDAVAGDFVHVPALHRPPGEQPGRQPSLAVIARVGGGVPTVNVEKRLPRTVRSTTVPRMRVLILGAGFGGLELATHPRCRARDDVEVMLIDKADGFVFGFSKLDVMFGRATADARACTPTPTCVKPGVRFVQATIRVDRPGQPGGSRPTPAPFDGRRPGGRPRRRPAPGGHARPGRGRPRVLHGAPARSRCATCSPRSPAVASSSA